MAWAVRADSLLTSKISMDANGVTRLPRRQLVLAAAAQLRDVILAREPNTQIGSLNEVAELLGVGIVTVQQAARILEHEGLLAVRRGPGGGYYGTRPDEAALERAFAADCACTDSRTENLTECCRSSIVRSFQPLPAARTRICGGWLGDCTRALIIVNRPSSASHSKQTCGFCC